VEVLGNPIGVTLTRRTGRVVRADALPGYVVVRLDAPATGEGGEVMWELREAEDNLRPLERQRMRGKR
jgi:hypothetical protein